MAFPEAPDQDLWT